MTLRMYLEGVHKHIEGWMKNVTTASWSTNSFVMLLINLWICGALMTVVLPIIPLLQVFKHVS